MHIHICAAVSRGTLDGWCPFGCPSKPSKAGTVKDRTPMQQCVHIEIFEPRTNLPAWCLKEVKCPTHVRPKRTIDLLCSLRCSRMCIHIYIYIYTYTHTRLCKWGTPPNGDSPSRNTHIYECVFLLRAPKNLTIPYIRPPTRIANLPLPRL